VELETSKAENLTGLLRSIKLVPKQLHWYDLLVPLVTLKQSMHLANYEDLSWHLLIGRIRSPSPVQHVHWVLGTGLTAVALVELVPFNDPIVELTGSDYCEQAQFEGLRGILAMTELKKNRLLQSQNARELLTALLQMQLDASRPTGQIYLDCMYWASETQQLQGRLKVSFRAGGQ